MLRFNRQNAIPQASSRIAKATTRAQRRQIWLLVGALGLVLLAMRYLGQPETAERLGELFDVEDTSSTSVQSSDFNVESGQSTIDDFELSAAPRALNTGGDASGASDSAEPMDLSSSALKAVRDNTYFRPAESDAWFGLFSQLRSSDSGQLARRSLGELSYAQLLKQPDYYRGKLVTVRGAVRRVEPQKAPQNAEGIESYHRLWIEPKGGANWPIVVYCLTLPDEFPRGDRLNANVAVTGYFFKNWSYPWQDGLGIAPVVLSRDVTWRTSLGSQSRSQPAKQWSFGRTALYVGLCLASALYIVLRLSQALRPAARPRLGPPGREAADPQEIRDQLKVLADAEPGQ